MYAAQNNLKIFHEGKDASPIYDIGVSFKNNSVISRKDEDSVQKYSGIKNIFHGLGAGEALLTGNENMFIGVESGFKSSGDVNAKRLIPLYNTFIGHYTGRDNTIGKENIFLGYKAGYTTETPQQKRNILIGNYTHNDGNDNIILGNSSSSLTSSNSVIIGTNVHQNSDNAIVCGANIENRGDNTLIIGNDITNSGSNSFILYPSANPYNTSNNYVNIFDIVEGYKEKELLSLIHI